MPDLPVIIDYCKEIKRERLRGISILPSREVQRKPRVAVGKNEMRASWTLQQLQRGQEQGRCERAVIRFADSRKADNFVQYLLCEVVKN